MTRKYSNLQIALHWAVVLLIVAQWWTADAIPRTHNPLLRPTMADLLQHKFHNYSGMTIGVLIALRVALRFLRKPGRLQITKGWRERAAGCVHWGLYATLAAQAFTGFVASYMWAPAAGIHKAIWLVTMTLISIHVSAAIWHIARRDDVLARMLPCKRAPQPPG